LGAGSQVDGGTAKADAPSDLAGFTYNDAAAPYNDAAAPSRDDAAIPYADAATAYDAASPVPDATVAPMLGCTVGGSAGSIDTASGKCVYQLCANDSECTNKAAPMTGIGTRPLDGRFPVTVTITNVASVSGTYQAASTPNAVALCARYGADYWAHVRRAVTPTCGAKYGLANASNPNGSSFDAEDYQLCLLSYSDFPGNVTGLPDSAFQVSGIPIIDQVWCQKTADSKGTPTGITPPAINSYNALPFDTDPHDNSDPRYQLPPPPPIEGGGA
jgi:hypothetical protein